MGHGKAETARPSAEMSDKLAAEQRRKFPPMV